MKKYLFSALIALAFINTDALAACSGVSCTDVKVTLLYINDGSTLIGTDGTESNLTNCVTTTYITLENAHSNDDKVFSLLLSAYITGESVQVRTVNTAGNTGACVVNYVTIDK